MSIEKLHDIENRERHDTRLWTLYGIAVAVIALGIVAMLMATVLGH